MTRYFISQIVSNPSFLATKQVHKFFYKYYEYKIDVPSKCNIFTNNTFI